MHARSLFLALALLPGLGLLAGCGDDRPTTRYADLLTDTSVSDEQAVRRMASGIRKIGGFDSRSELATVSTDAEGRPSISIRINPDISDSATQLTVMSEGEEWTADTPRSDDIGSLNLALSMSDFGDIVRVGAARNLQQIDFTIVKKVATDEGDQVLEVLRATLPRTKIEELAALPLDEYGQLEFDVSEHWTIVRDDYDQLSFGPGD